MTRKDARLMSEPSPARHAILAALLALPALAGCQRPLSHDVQAPYPTTRSLVVLPLLNQSPSQDFDTVALTDALVAELAQVDGLLVFPTNRPLKLLIARGQTHAISETQAKEIAHDLGADGVLVGAVTEYDPYSPQKMGMWLQLFWVRADISLAGLNPTEYSRRATPGDPGYAGRGGAFSQVRAVFDASRNDVVERVRLYAENHRGQDSPYGWRKYLASSKLYSEFVCREMVVMLLQRELERITVPVVARTQ